MSAYQKFPAGTQVFVQYAGELWPARVHEKTAYDISAVPEPDLVDPKSGSLCVQYYDDPNDPSGGSVSLVDPSLCSKLDFKDKASNEKHIALMGNMVRAGLALAVRDGEKLEKAKKLEEAAERDRKAAEEKAKQAAAAAELKRAGAGDRNLVMRQLLGTEDDGDAAAGTIRQRDGQGANAGGLAPPPPRPPAVPGQQKPLERKNSAGGSSKATKGAATAAAAAAAATRGKEGGSGASEWCGEDAKAVFGEVEAAASVFYRNPKIIGAFTFDGCVTRNEAARAAAGFHGTKMHLSIPRFGPEYIQPKFFLVPTHDDSLIYPWMEQLPFDGRQVKMIVKVEDQEFPVPANWKIPASRQQQWAAARSPIPLDITAAIMKKSPPPQKVQVSIFIDGLMKSDAAAAAGAAAGTAKKVGKMTEENAPRKPTREEEDAISDFAWSGVLVALVAECARPDRDLIADLQKNPVADIADVQAIDDASTTSKVTVSRKCAISMQDMKAPVRSRFCVHAQCADATSVVQLARRTFLWRCPHCLCSAMPIDWGVDTDFKAALEANPKSTEFLAIGPDTKGKYKYEPRN